MLVAHVEHGFPSAHTQKHPSSSSYIKLGNPINQSPSKSRAMVFAGLGETCSSNYLFRSIDWPSQVRAGPNNYTNFPSSNWTAFPDAGESAHTHSTTLALDSAPDHLMFREMDVRCNHARHYVDGRFNEMRSRNDGREFVVMGWGSALYKVFKF